jgi:uncharacterized membrane protein
MTTAHHDQIVASYLHRLEIAAQALPRERRMELVSEIRAHIDEALNEAGATDEVTVRNVLERLGSPEQIVAEAVGTRPRPMSSRGPHELAALIALALGGILPVIGWAFGVVLVVASPAWSARDKGTGLALGLVASLMVPALVIATPAGGGLGPIEIFLLFGLGIVAGPLSAAYLAHRLRHGGEALDEAHSLGV